MEQVYEKKIVKRGERRKEEENEAIVRKRKKRKAIPNNLDPVINYVIPTFLKI